MNIICYLIGHKYTTLKTHHVNVIAPLDGGVIRNTIMNTYDYCCSRCGKEVPIDIAKDIDCMTNDEIEKEIENLTNFN